MVSFSNFLVTARRPKRSSLSQELANPPTSLSYRSMAAKVAPQGRRLRNAVLFEREDVRVMDSGVVLTKNLIEIEQIKRIPGRFRTSLNFPREMTSDEVRSELEKYFPQVKNRRFSCAARETQNSARLDFHGDHHVWDGKTINKKLRGGSVLYLVMEDEPPVSKEMFCPTESGSSMQESNLDAEVSLSPLLDGSFGDEEFMDEDFQPMPTDYFVMDDLLDGMDSTQRNGQSQITRRGSFPLSADFENCRFGPGSTVQTSSPMNSTAFNNDWNGTVGTMPPIAQVLAPSQPYQYQVSEAPSTYTDTDGPSESGFLSEGCFASDDLLDGVDSTQRNGQSQITQGGSFPLSADFENCCFGLGSTVQTSSPMTSTAFNNDWNGTVGAIPPIAPVLPPSQAYQNQVSEACSTNTDISGPPESGFSSEGNSSIDGQDLDLPQIIPSDASVEVKPSKGPLEGGGVFQLKFDKNLPDAVTSAWATFGYKQVEVRKTHESSFILHGESIPAGEVPGTVAVTITTKNGDYLGATSFTYVDREKEMLMHIINSEKLLGELFTMLGKKYENVERGQNNTQTFELDSDGRQRQALDLSFLRSLVYTAAGNGAKELIRMIFSTSAGRIVFDSYKKESPLPEDVADANGHEETATFLRAITKRFSEEDTTSHMQSGGTNWRNLSRAVEESEEQSVSWSSEKHVKQLKENDLSERQYFGDAETSSSDSEEERCHFEDQFEAKFSKDQDPIQMGLDSSHQMTERDIHDYRLAEKIGGKWKDLARALDSSDHCQANINRIQKDQGGFTKECCIEVLVRWMSREGRNATVGKLAEALGKVELKNIADELMDTTQNDRFNMTMSQMQTNCNCKHLDGLKEEGSKMRRTIKERENKYQDAKRENFEMRSKMEQLKARLQDSEHENFEMRSKMEQLETGLQDSEHECSTLRTKILELEEDLTIQRKQQQDSTEQGLGNSVDAATKLDEVSVVTRNDLGIDQENRERRIALQLKRLDGKLRNELTSPLQVPEVKEDKLKTAVKLDLLRNLSESLQNIYSDINAMVAETCKCNEDLKREFYDFAYHGVRAEHNDLVLRVNDLESSQAEMSDEEKKAFKRLQQYEINRQRQIDRLENFWRGLFSSTVSLPETSSSYPTGGNNGKKGLGNAADAVTELKDVSGATRNYLDTDQENRERRIAIQLKNLDEKLKKEVTSMLQVPEVRLDNLKTAVNLVLLTKLSESLQNIYSDIQAMVAETCKCNEDLKREFYDFAYHSLRAEHNDLVHRVNDLESSQAEMSDEEKNAFKRLLQYQINRQRQVDRLENFWRGLFYSALSRNGTDPGTRQKQTSARTPPMSDEEKSEVCILTIKKRSTMKRIFRSKESKENLCHPVSYRPHRDS